MPKFKNIANEELSIPGVGVVKPGEVVEIKEGFYNANFKKIDEVKVEKPTKKEEKHD